jgi:hypothetical protein
MKVEHKNECDGCCLCYDAEQLPLWEENTIDGVFIKQMHLKDAGLVVPQHSHTYGHTTLLAHGKLRAWKDDELLGDFDAPAQIYIAAGAKHTFLSLVPNTVAYCIHNVSRTGRVEIHESHELNQKVLERAARSVS